MVWNMRHKKYRAVEIMASTTARRITASRICNRGVGFNDLILMDGAGAAARAVPAPVCASKFASLTTRDSFGWRGRSLRVTNLRSARLRILQQLQPRANTAVALLGERICCIYQKASKQGLSPGQRRLQVYFSALGDTWVQMRVPRPHRIGKRFWRIGIVSILILGTSPLTDWEWQLTPSSA